MRHMVPPVLDPDRVRRRPERRSAGHVAAGGPGVAPGPRRGADDAHGGRAMSAQARPHSATIHPDVPGGRLLHPVVLASIALFVVNDHVFKPAHPGWLTGKLSDVAGLIFFPVLLAAVAELLIPAARRHGSAILVLAVVITGLTYVAMLV